VAGVARIRATPGRRIAHAPVTMILVAVDRVVTRADARLARITTRAGIPVIAAATVGLL